MQRTSFKFTWTSVVRLIHIHRSTSSTSIGNDLHRCIAARYIVPCYLLCYPRAVDIGEGRREGRNREKETSILGNPPIQYEWHCFGRQLSLWRKACGHSCTRKSFVRPSRTLPTTRSSGSLPKTFICKPGDSGSFWARRRVTGECTDGKRIKQAMKPPDTTRT